MRRLLVLLALAGAGCSAPWDDGGIGGALDDAAEGARSSEEAAIVDLREVTDFAWDRVYLFGPYSDRDEAERRLGFSWPDANDELPQTREVDTLVFTEGEHVVEVVTYTFREGRTSLVCLELDEDGYARDDSVFRAALAGSEAVLVPASLDADERAEYVWTCGVGVR